MGYTLTIGEAQLETSEERIGIGARGERHDSAPAFGEPTDGTNSRWPSYTAWHDFCREVGIHELFYGSGWSPDERRYLECPDGFHRESPLLGHHPGAALLTVGDRQFVRSALERYRAAHPGVSPGFTDDEIAPPTASALARLIWLDYWIGWAVENCTNPVLENS